MCDFVLLVSVWASSCSAPFLHGRLHHSPFHSLLSSPLITALCFMTQGNKRRELWRFRCTRKWDFKETFKAKYDSTSNQSLRVWSDHFRENRWSRWGTEDLERSRPHHLQRGGGYIISSIICSTRKHLFLLCCGRIPLTLGAKLQKPFLCRNKRLPGDWVEKWTCLGFQSTVLAHLLPGRARRTRSFTFAFVLPPHAGTGSTSGRHCSALFEILLEKQLPVYENVFLNVFFFLKVTFN